MIIAITGTPGTGKTSVAKELSKKLGYWYVSLNDLAKEEGLYKGYDEDRMCDIVDIKKLRREVNILAITHKRMLLDGHYSHEMPSDIVVVLRAKPQELRRRMEKKGYGERKIRENLEAEVMEVIKCEAFSSHSNVYEIDTTSKHPPAVAKEIEAFVKENVFINEDLRVPDDLLVEFRKPFGKLLSGTECESASKAKKAVKGKKSMVISVGDMASHSLLTNGVKVDIIIVDGKVKRKKFEKQIPFRGRTIKVKNPARHITVDLWKAVEKAIRSKKRKFRINVEGEEDLAVLPCAMHAPDGSYIFYGQFDKGLVMVRVDKKKKERARALLENIMFS